MGDSMANRQDEISLLVFLTNGAASKEEAARALDKFHGDLESAQAWLDSSKPFSSLSDTKSSVAEKTECGELEYTPTDAAEDAIAARTMSDGNATEATAAKLPSSRHATTRHVVEEQQKEYWNVSAASSTPSLGMMALSAAASSSSTTRNQDMPGAVGSAAVVSADRNEVRPGAEHVGGIGDNSSTAVSSTTSPVAQQQRSQEEPFVVEAATVYDDDRELLLHRVEELEEIVMAHGRQQIVHGELVPPNNDEQQQHGQHVVANQDDDEEEGNDDETHSKRDTQKNRQVFPIFQSPTPGSLSQSFLDNVRKPSLLSCLMRSTVFVAWALSLAANFTCNYITIDVTIDDLEYYLGYGLWRYQDWSFLIESETNHWPFHIESKTFYYDGTCYPYGSVVYPDSKWKTARAFSIISVVVGGLAMASSCCLICAPNPSKGCLCFAFLYLFTCLSQGLTFLFLQSDACLSSLVFSTEVPDGITRGASCNLSWGANSSIAATCLWFVSACVMCYIGFKEQRGVNEADNAREEPV